jgi:flavin-dependent dehydrogenase
VIIERNQFSQMLLSRMAATDAEIHYGYRFQYAEPTDGGARLRFRTAKGEIAQVTARAVIGADGIVSRVASAAGIPLPPAEPILHAEITLPYGWNPSETKVWFDTRDSRYFYWLVPESAHHGVIGLVGDGRAKTRSLVEAFLERHGMRATGWQGARVAMHHPRLRPWGRIGSAPVLPVGDAAGQVKVTTVGGTVTGLWGAAAAAQSLLRGRSYASMLRPLKRELDVHWYIRWLLERLDNHGYDQLVRLISPPIQHLLSTRNRDEMAGAAWRIPLLQPRLIPLMLLPDRFGNGAVVERPLPLTVRPNR